MSRWKYLVLIFIVLPLLIGSFLVGQFFFRVWNVSEKITFGNIKPPTVDTSPENTFAVETPDLSGLNNVATIDEATKNEYKRQFGLLDFAKEKTFPQKGTHERINILLLGKAVPGYPGSDLTDTIILASINPTTYQSSLISIPRDLYVAVPNTKLFTKINALYVYGLKMGGHQKGIEILEQAVSEITGQKIDYYVMVNFSAFEEAVNTLGGVDVQVENDIYDNRYPGPNFSYQTFAIEKGPHHLDGATALKYVRVRHIAGGDFGRARRQQQVIESLKNKFFEKRGLKESLDFFNQILKIIQDNVKTDIGFSDYFPFLLLIKDIDESKIVNKVLDNSPEGLLEDYNPTIGQIRAYTLRPRSGNYYEIRKLANYILQLDIADRQEKARNQEQARVAVITTPGLTNLGDKARDILRSKNYQIVEGDFNLANVFLWQRKADSHLPVVSGANRKNLTSASLIDKITLNLDNIKQTIIYDNAEGRKPFSLDDLSRRFDGQISLYKEPSIDADFVIILGQNAQQIFVPGDEKDFFLTDEGLEQEKSENGVTPSN